MSSRNEPPSLAGIDLDPQVADRRKAEKLYRLNVVQTPILRVIGFGFFVVVVYLHNAYYLGEVSWRDIGLLSVLSFSYAMVSWLVLYAFYERVRRLSLGDVFLAIDPFMWAVALYYSGGERSLLFFAMLLRVADQSYTSFRRALVFAHICTLAYVALLVYLIFVEGRPVLVGAEAAKVVFIYLASVYIALTGKSAEILRNQTIDAIRLARESILKLRSTTREAEESRARAEEANRSKSVFLANMSHELRTPLNAILGFVQLMERDRTLGTEQHENLAIINRSGEYLLSLINDVLSISKIEAGKLTLTENVFDLRQLLQGLEEMIRYRAQAKRLQFLTDVAPDVPRFVRGDEGKLRQVLINLLGNAVKFTDSGGLSLRVRWRDGLTTFEVEDTGHGIAPDEIPQLFEAFVQTESGRKSLEGTGLGLAISRHFVRQMGGDIRVRSAIGTGTLFTFDVMLPVAAWIDEEGEPSRVVGLELGHPEVRVLVVDDVWENRLLLVKLLTLVGIDAREAANGREAVEMWQSWHPHLIWMDMRMPVMSGYDATKEIRALERLARTVEHSDDNAWTGNRESHATDALEDDRVSTGRHCVIIALTASAFEHDRDEILAVGCDDFVAKPFREGTIFERLSQHIGVRFRLEAPEPAVDPLPLLDSAIPSEFTTELRDAITAGDLTGSLEVIDRIAGKDAALAVSLRALIKGYRIEEILERLEREGHATPGD